MPGPGMITIGCCSNGERYLPVSAAWTFFRLSMFFCKPVTWSCISTRDEPIWAIDPTEPPSDLCVGIALAQRPTNVSQSENAQDHQHRKMSRDCLYLHKCLLYRSLSELRTYIIE